MDSTTQATIEKIHAQIGVLEEQIDKKKEAINMLCELEGESPLYPDVGKARASINATFRGDQFFGKPIATAVREILEQRSARNQGAIPLNELFDVMKAGGFEFDNNNEQIAKRNLAITLAKNPAFMKVPANGFIGLAEWYPHVKKKKQKSQEDETGERPSGAKLELIEVDERNLARKAN